MSDERTGASDHIERLAALAEKRQAERDEARAEVERLRSQLADAHHNIELMTLGRDTAAAERDEARVETDRLREDVVLIRRDVAYADSSVVDRLSLIARLDTVLRASQPDAERAPEDGYAIDAQGDVSTQPRHTERAPQGEDHECPDCWGGRPKWAGTMPAPPCPTCGGTGKRSPEDDR